MWPSGKVSTHDRVNRHVLVKMTLNNGFHNRRSTVRLDKRLPDSE